MPAKDPHHLFPDVERLSVGHVQVRQGVRKVENLDPDITEDQIAEKLYGLGYAGGGDFTLYPLDFQPPFKQLKGRLAFHLNPKDSNGGLGGGHIITQDPTTGGLFAHLLERQLELLERREQACDDREARLDDRETAITEREHQLNQRLRDAERDSDVRRLESQLTSDQRRQLDEASHRARMVEIEAQSRAAIAKIEADSKAAIAAAQASVDAERRRVTEEADRRRTEIHTQEMRTLELTHQAELTLTQAQAAQQAGSPLGFISALDPAVQSDVIRSILPQPEPPDEFTKYLPLVDIVGAAVDRIKGALTGIRPIAPTRSPQTGNGQAPQGVTPALPGPTGPQSFSG